MAVETETTIYRSKLTAQFLDSDAYADAVAAVEQGIKAEWAVADGVVRREELWAEYQSFQRLKTRLRALRDRATLDAPEE